MIDYVNPTLGGLLIGLSATTLLLGSGRVAGISGLLANLLFKNNKLLPGLFFLGLIIGGIAANTLFNTTTQTAEMSRPIWLLVLSGLLVGYGTRLGSGCTSGHGVCGISRLSARSLVATCTFIATAIITVAITK